MKHRLVRAAGVTVLALALFAAAGVGVFRALDPRSRRSRRADDGAQVAPAVTAGRCRTRSPSLQDRLRVSPTMNGPTRCSASPTSRPRACTPTPVLPQGRGRPPAIPGAEPNGDDEEARARDGRRSRWHVTTSPAASGLGPSAPDGAQPRRLPPPRRHRRRPARARPTTAAPSRRSTGWCGRVPMSPPTLGSPTRATPRQTGPAPRAMRMAAGAAGTPEDPAWVRYQIGDSRTSRAVDLALGVHFADPGRRRCPRRSVPAEAGLARIAWARGTHAARSPVTDRSSPAPRLPEYVIALGDLYGSTAEPTRRRSATPWRKAEAALLPRQWGQRRRRTRRSSKPTTADPTRPRSTDARRVALPPQHPRRRRAGLGAVPERAAGFGGSLRAAGAAARHTGRALVLPRRHDRNAAGRPGDGSAPARARARDQPAFLDPVRGARAANPRSAPRVKPPSPTS